MKKFLSLVLALIMTMSLVTISAGAKDFTDDDKITYDEAVAVISTIGVVDGDTNGAFRPTDTLTRQAAAKIICNLILGPTTAAELHADTAPYKDVAANNQFAGYIAYCQSRGIISGYADGTFRPTGTLTGYAFMKMLLGALGYDSSLEGYVGTNWSINVAKQALGIGLNKGLVDEFNGIKAVTREEACLYAFRTLQSDLVEYNQRLTTSINGTEVTLSSGGAKSRSWNSQQSRYDYIRDDNLIQFAEEYFNKLEKKKDTDIFERPAYTWIYDKEEIGTYVDWELKVAEFTTGVSGRDMYDAIGANNMNNNELALVYYVDGLVPGDPGLPTRVAASTDNITKGGSTALLRSNKNDVGKTDRGVLTEVFIDKDYKKITITSINTWLGKCAAGYDSTKEYATLDVWVNIAAKKSVTETWVINVDDVPEIEILENDGYYLTQISFKDEPVKGEVVTVWEPDVLEDSEVTKFSSNADVLGKNNMVTKVTTGGTEYKANLRAYYDTKALYDYDKTLLTDRTYNIYLDQFGNFIGVELAEGEKNYVFITGFDRPRSNLSVQTANAAGIFLDGTMQAFSVNVTDTDKNIERARANGDLSVGREYFIPWREFTSAGAAKTDNGFYALNRWFTYSVNEAGVYTLKPATNMVVVNYTDDTTIKTANLFLDDNKQVKTGVPYYGVAGTDSGDGTGVTGYDYQWTNGNRAYGNDDSVYITVETDIVDTQMAAARSITDVNGVYTGVQNVEIEIDVSDINNERPVEEAFVYAVYDDDHYIIGCVTVGEAKGSNATVVYITSDVKSERKEGDTYYWEFDAIIGGVEKTLTAKSKFTSIFTDVIHVESDATHKKLITKGGIAEDTYAGHTDWNWNEHDGLVELRFDSDEYVVAAKPVTEDKIFSYYGDRTAGVGSNLYMGNWSYSQNTDSYTADGMATGDAALKIEDAKAYRIGGIHKGMVEGWTLGENTLLPGTGKTWANPNCDANQHHYDSSPNELTLVGRTLYVTAGQIDQGLALEQDAKAVVIQRESGKWTTTEFNSVAQAVNRLADANTNVAGLQYNGEVVAVMGSRGAAAWVVFTNYENLVTGGTSAAGYNSVTGVDVLGDPGNSYKLADGTTTAGYTYPTIKFDIIGTNRNQSYRVTLEQYTYGGVWSEFTSWSELETGTSGTLTCTATVGTLPSGFSYRLRVGDGVNARYSVPIVAP